MNDLSAAIGTTLNQGYSHNTHYITLSITVSKPVLGPSRLLSNRYWSLVSLVWMFELHLQLPCVLASWNNTICKLRSHHPIHDFLSTPQVTQYHFRLCNFYCHVKLKDSYLLSCETEGQLFGNDLSNCYVRHDNVVIVNKRNNTTKWESDQQEI